MPKKSRIDIGPPENGNGYVLVDREVSIMKGNQVTATRRSVNMLLVFGFDVYRQDPAITANSCIIGARGERGSPLHRKFIRKGRKSFRRITARSRKT